MKITLTRAEGPSEQCGKPVSFTSFEGAQSAIRLWNSSVNPGSYDKVDFVIIDESIDLAYKGTYYMHHWSESKDSLKCHVIGYLEYLQNEHRYEDSTHKVIEFVKGQK